MDQPEDLRSNYERSLREQYIPFFSVCQPSGGKSVKKTRANFKKYLVIFT